MKLTRCSI